MTLGAWIVTLTVVPAITALCWLQACDSPSEDDPDRPSEDELRAMGLSGEWYHAVETDTVDEFWRRFGPRIAKELPLMRSKVRTI